MKFYLHLFIIILGGYILQSCMSPSLNECYTNEKEERVYPYYPEYDEDSLYIHFLAKDSSFKMVLPRDFRNIVSGKYTRRGRSLVLHPDIYIIEKEYHSDISKGIINLNFTYKDTFFYNNSFIIDSVFFFINGQRVRTDSNGTINYKIKRWNSKIIDIKGILGNGYALYLNIDNSEFNFYKITMTKLFSCFDTSFFKLRLRRDGLLINKTGYKWKPIQCNKQVINL